MCSTETPNSNLVGKSVYNHRLLTHSETTFFGVFDGHGGPEAAKFTQNNLLEEIDKEFSNSQDLQQALHNGFVSVTEKMWKKLGNVFSETIFDYSFKLGVIHKFITAIVRVYCDKISIYIN